MKSMWMKTAVAGALVTTALTIVPAGFSAKPSPEIPVTVEFRDFACDAITPADRIKSDGKGIYSNGIDNVDAVFMGSGNLRLITNTARGAAIRKVHLDFGDVVTENESIPKPFLAGSVEVDMRNHVLNPECTANALSNGLLGLPLGTTNGRASIGIAFDDAVAKTFSWSLRRHQTFPQTICALATHQQDAAGEFWTLEANWPSDIAVLTKVTTGGTPNEQGYYHMPFRIVIRKK
jgi:hypothetical protein